jgi:NADH-quinone oxidoreductase subunit M
MEFLDNNILLLIILLPSVGSLFLLFFKDTDPVNTRTFAMIISVAGLILSVYLFSSALSSKELGDFSSSITWLPSLGIHLNLSISGPTSALVLLNAVIFFASILVSRNIEIRPNHFFFWLMLLVGGVYGVFLSQDLFFFFFFYELAVVPMYLLIAVWGSSSDFVSFIRTKEYGAMKLTLYLVAGSVLVWVGILALWAEGAETLGAFTMDINTLRNVNYDRDFQLFFFPFFMIGFGILAGLWPFHTWSPDGHVAAPTAVSMLHAGVLMKLGAFGILQIGILLLPEGAIYWSPLFMSLGIINVLYGSISALAQQDLKYVIGYSSVSHMGYVLLGLATLNSTGFNGAILQMVSHGIMTALFFALVGFIYEQTHTRNIQILEGLAKKMPIAAGFFTLAGLTSLGLPGLSGFVAELLIFIGLFKTSPLIAILAIIGAAITAVYILRLIAKVFFGPVNVQWEHLRDFSKSETLPILFLTLFIVGIGLFPWPIMNVIDSGIEQFVAKLSGV